MVNYLSIHMYICVCVCVCVCVYVCGRVKLNESGQRCNIPIVCFCGKTDILDFHGNRIVKMALVSVITVIR